jgi:hypothetical protein
MMRVTIAVPPAQLDELDDADLTALDRVGRGTEPTRGPQGERRASQVGRISERVLHSRKPRG